MKSLGTVSVSQSTKRVSQKEKQKLSKLKVVKEWYVPACDGGGPHYSK